MKYLFGALFESGEHYYQTTDNCSLAVPGRNAFYDLLLHDDKGEIVAHPKDGKAIPRADIAVFQLAPAEWFMQQSDAKNGPTYLVDLTDGHFEVGGRPFFIQPPPKNQKLFLVYFQRVRQRMETNVAHDGTVLNRVLLPEEREYHFGWTVEDRSESATMFLV
jgi:hypothetical protein